MAYAQAADMMKRIDVRVLGDLVSDSSVRVSPTALPNDPNLQAALDDAAAVIDAAVLVANRYTTAQLTALTGQAQALLFRLNCNLAYGLLVLRRGQVSEMPVQYLEGLNLLEALREGKNVFNIAANEEAGNPQAVFPSLVQYQTLNLLRDAAWRYFPSRRVQNQIS